jgi:hypothetical protein
MPKKRNSEKSKIVVVHLYGIWSKRKKLLVYVSLKEDDADMEFDMEGYSDDHYALVKLDTQYDISSLAP